LQRIANRPGITQLNENLPSATTVGRLVGWLVAVEVNRESKLKKEKLAQDNLIKLPFVRVEKTIK